MARSGGSSLAVVQVLSRMHDRGLPAVSVGDFYAHSTIADFVTLVRLRHAADGDTVQPVSLVGISTSIRTTRSPRPRPCSTGMPAPR